MRRTIALGAAWTASAAAAVGLGFLAVSLVDASAFPGTQPVATTDTAGQTSAAASATAVPSPTSATEQYVTAGGTVFADCATGSPVLAGVPAAGWSVDDSNAVGQAEFRAGDRTVEVHVTCADGVPVFTLDDSSGTPHVTPSQSASSTSGADDSSGRDGGGHGADDSSGGGGGHGAPG